MNYFKQQPFSELRPYTVDHEIDVLCRPPSKLKNCGIYTGEWNLDTMQVHGFGHIQYSQQFMGFYKTGYFINERLSHPEIRSKKWFTDPKTNKPIVQEGIFEDGYLIKGLTIANDEVRFADENSPEDQAQSFNDHVADGNSPAIFKKWERYQVSFGVWRNNGK